jgi:hypothetical protein
VSGPAQSRSSPASPRKPESPTAPSPLYGNCYRYLYLRIQPRHSPPLFFGSIPCSIRCAITRVFKSSARKSSRESTELLDRAQAAERLHSRAAERRRATARERPDERTAESEVQQLTREVRTLSEKIDALRAAQSAEHEVLGNHR